MGLSFIHLFGTPPRRADWAAGQMPSKLVCSFCLICLVIYHKFHSHQVQPPQGSKLSTPPTVYSTPLTPATLLHLLLGSPSVEDVSSASIWTMLLFSALEIPGSHMSWDKLTSPQLLMSPGVPIQLLTPSRQLSLQPLRRIETSCPHCQSTCSDSVLGPRISVRSRTRWLLLQTLINNPGLIKLRKSRSGHSSQEFTQILLTCSES